MAVRVYPFDVLTPAGTAQGAPLSTPLALEDGNLKAIRLIIPDGHCGLTGIRLLQASQQVFPWSNLHYIIGNNRIVEFPYEHEVTVSGLAAVTYNTDTFDHTHYLEIVVDDLPAPLPPSSNGQSAPIIVPTSAPQIADPLSPDALLAGLPSDAELVFDTPDLPV